MICVDIATLISSIIFFGVIFGWKLFDHLQKSYRSQNMYKKVGWIAEKESLNMVYSESVQLRDYDLLSYIIEEQSKLNISKEFCIDFSNEGEKKNVEEILNYHKNKVVELYFRGFLSKSRKVCQLSSLEYYFFSLYSFLYKEIDKGQSSFKWSLNDNGRAFFKIYLITNMFVENNEKTKNLFDYINPNLKKLTMEHLEKINLHYEERKINYGTKNI